MSARYVEIALFHVWTSDGRPVCEAASVTRENAEEIRRALRARGVLAWYGPAEMGPGPAKQWFYRERALVQA